MKILTWNVQWFCGLDGVVDVARVVAHARQMADFDVLCLQEVACNYPRLDGDASADQVGQLRALLPEFSVFFGAAVDELAPDGRSRQRFGNVLATRLPAAQVHRYSLPWPADPTTDGVRSMPRVCVAATLMAPFGAVRVMTTHLEFYAPAMRMAQAHELLRLHGEACARAAYPPLNDDTGSPFQSKPHTAHCVLTGDFNLEPHEPEYALLQSAQPGASRLVDAWRVCHGERAHPPTFRLFDRRYGPEPISCDFIFVSDTLSGRVRDVRADVLTRLSDHQPVLLELAD